MQKKKSSYDQRAIMLISTSKRGYNFCTHLCALKLDRHFVTFFVLLASACATDTMGSDRTHDKRERAGDLLFINPTVLHKVVEWARDNDRKVVVFSI